MTSSNTLLSALYILIPTLWLAGCGGAVQQQSSEQERTNREDIHVSDTAEKHTGRKTDPDQKLNNAPQRITEDGAQHIIFPAADSMKLNILSYNPVSIPPANILDFKKTENRFFVDLTEISEERKRDIAAFYELKDEEVLDTAQTMDFWSYSICNNKICTIIYYVILYTEQPYSKMKHLASNLFFLNTQGKIINQVTLPDIGAQALRLTSDGKYAMTLNGGRYGEGGGLYLPYRHAVINVKTGDILLKTDFFGDAVLSNYNNLFYVRQYTSKKNGSFYNIINPHQRKIYRLDISGETISKFKELTNNGILLKDGSMLRFDRDFKTYTFDQIKNRKE